MNQLDRPHWAWGIAALVVFALLRGCLSAGTPDNRLPSGECVRCEGSGRVPCDHCKGGWVKTYNNPNVENEGYSCAVCGGDGLCTCVSCGGSGH